MSESLEEAIGPLADRLEMAGKLGCSITLSPDAAIAAGKGMRLLARYGDVSDALDWRRRCFNSFWLRLALLIGAVAALAWCDQ